MRHLQAAIFTFFAIVQLTNGEENDSMPIRQTFAKKVNMLFKPEFQKQVGGGIGLQVFRGNEYPVLAVMHLHYTNTSTFHVRLTCEALAKPNAVSANIIEHLSGWKTIPGVVPTFHIKKKVLDDILNELGSRRIPVERSMCIRRDDKGHVLLLIKELEFDLKSSQVGAIEKIFGIYFAIAGPANAANVIFTYTSNVKDKHIVEVPQ